MTLLDNYRVFETSASFDKENGVGILFSSPVGDIDKSEQQRRARMIKEIIKQLFQNSEPIIFLINSYIGNKKNTDGGKLIKNIHKWSMGSFGYTDEYNDSYYRFYWKVPFNALKLDHFGSGIASVDFPNQWSEAPKLNSPIFALISEEKQIIVECFDDRGLNLYIENKAYRQIIIKKYSKPEYELWQHGKQIY